MKNIIILILSITVSFAGNCQYKSSTKDVYKYCLNIAFASTYSEGIIYGIRNPKRIEDYEYTESIRLYQRGMLYGNKCLNECLKFNKYITKKQNVK